jgi:hypothetical protein
MTVIHDGRPTISDPRSDARVVDCVFHDFRSLVVLEARSLAGKEWVNEHINTDEIWWNSHTCIEPRYAQAILEGLREAGLRIEIA